MCRGRLTPAIEMNDELKKLLDLQEIDLVIGIAERELELIPAQTDDLRNKIKGLNAAFEAEKQKLTQVQLDRKSRELEVASQDEKIAKHEKELNTLKSNESYKAMLGEIDLAKNKKSEIEDQILNLMEEYDKRSGELKAMDAENRKIQADLEKEIKALEEKTVKLKSDLDAEFKRREAFVPAVRSDLLTRYDFIRTKKKSNAIAPITGESCSGCNTNLTPSILNEVRKGKELIICESCSRILYYPAAQTQTAPA